MTACQGCWQWRVARLPARRGSLWVAESFAGRYTAFFHAVPYWCAYLPAGTPRQWTGQWFVRYGSCPALSHLTAFICVASRNQELVSGIPALWQHSWNRIIGGLQPWKAFNTETPVTEKWRGEHWVREDCWEGQGCWGKCWSELYIPWKTPDVRLRDGWWPTYFPVQKVRRAGRWSVYCVLTFS